MTRPVTSKEPPSGERAVSNLVELAKRSTGGELSAREQAGVVAFEQAVARRTLRRRGRTFWVFGLAAAAAGIALFLSSTGARDGALTFSVENGTVSDGG